MNGHPWVRLTSFGLFAITLALANVARAEDPVDASACIEEGWSKRHTWSKATERHLTNRCRHPVFAFWCVSGGTEEIACGGGNYYRKGRVFDPGEIQHNRFTIPETGPLTVGACWGGKPEFDGSGGFVCCEAGPPTTSLSAYAATEDGEEIRFHLETMRRKRCDTVEERLDWLRKELEDTLAGCCGRGAEAIERRAAFLVELMTSLTDANARSEPVAGPSDPRAGTAAPEAPARSEPGAVAGIVLRPSDLKALESLREDAEAAGLMSWILEAGPLLVCLRNPNKACRITAGALAGAAESADAGVKTLHRSACRLTAVTHATALDTSRELRRFWQAVYEGYCSQL